ncbi:MAG: LexA family protein [Candidatus Competibacterales bacterium]
MLAWLTPAVHPTFCPRPLFASTVPAGFPSPADDYVEGQLDLNEYLIERPAATFFVRVTGDSMVGAGIFPGDILVVDRAREPVHGAIVIAVVNNELTVKRLYRRRGLLELRPENPAYTPLVVGGEMELLVWGVVTGVTRKL